MSDFKFPPTFEDDLRKARQKGRTVTVVYFGNRKIVGQVMEIYSISGTVKIRMKDGSEIKLRLSTIKSVQIA